MITRIREVRKAKGLTLEQVGALCDPPTTAQTIGRLETGTRTVSVKWLNRIADALGEGLRRLPGGTFAVWYPLTARARTDDFFARLETMSLPPSFTAELTVSPTAEKMRGCGLLVVNPPWQFDAEARALAERLAAALAQSPGGGAELRWIVPER